MSRTLKLSVALVITLLFAIAAKAGPEQLANYQSVELIEAGANHKYTERTIKVLAASDGTATVCVRAADAPKDSRVKCFYHIRGTNFVVVLDEPIYGESAT